MSIQEELEIRKQKLNRSNDVLRMTLARLCAVEKLETQVSIYLTQRHRLLLRDALRRSHERTEQASVAMQESPVPRPYVIDHDRFATGMSTPTGIDAIAATVPKQAGHFDLSQRDVDAHDAIPLVKIGQRTEWVISQRDQKNDPFASGRLRHQLNRGDVGAPLR